MGDGVHGLLRRNADDGCSRRNAGALEGEETLDLSVRALRHQSDPPQGTREFREWPGVLQRRQPRTPPAVQKAEGKATEERY